MSGGIMSTPSADSVGAPAPEAAIREKQRRTLRALGLTKNQTSVVQNDTPAIRGMINQIPHMLSVREIEG